jgi:hypothetical protein
MAKIDEKLRQLELGRYLDASLDPVCDGKMELQRIQNGRCRMSYQIIVWSAVVWVAICIAPYVYALNDLTTWP